MRSYLHFHSFKKKLVADRAGKDPKVKGGQSSAGGHFEAMEVGDDSSLKLKIT